MEKIISEMMKKVDEFQKKITNVPYADGLPERSRHGHLLEEVSEIIECHDAGDVPGVVDGLIDLVYVALGTLLQMGILPSHPFDIVHAANMRKRGEKTARHEHDAVKPEGWEAPDFREMLEHLELLYQVSPVFVELTKLRAHKGDNYNSPNVKRIDHFPLGDLSYFQVIWMKLCRVRALLEKNGDRRLVDREVSDILVYGCFWLEYMRGIDL